MNAPTPPRRPTAVDPFRPLAPVVAAAAEVGPTAWGYVVEVVVRFHTGKELAAPIHPAAPPDIESTAAAPPSLPAADADGVPSSPLHREILVALIDGPLKVAAIATACHVAEPRLYDRGSSLRELVSMGHLERAQSGKGYQLTARGRQAASMVLAEREEVRV